MTVGCSRELFEGAGTVYITEEITVCERVVVLQQKVRMKIKSEIKYTDRSTEEPVATVSGQTVVEVVKVSVITSSVADEVSSLNAGG